MKIIAAFICILFFSISSSISDDNTEKLKEISKQLNTIKSLYESGVLEKTEYENSKTKLLAKKAALQPQKKTKKTQKKSTDLDKQLDVIKKLFDDGVLSEEDYNKTKKILISKYEEKKQEESENYVADPSLFQLNIKETHGKNWEKAEIIYKNYRIYTYRPGGIRVETSSGVKLVSITDNFKVKYYNNGESVITIKKKVMKMPRVVDTLNEHAEALEDGTILDKLFKKKKKKKFDKNAHKLELFIEGRKILHWEGRYVEKHRAFFYQVLTADFQSFHFYIRMAGRAAIALQMEFFNLKIDKAVRAAKERLSVEYDITMEEIDNIINEKIQEEAGKAVEAGIKDAIEKSVSEAVAQSVGEAMSAGLVAAIEEATGEAIDDALEAELAAAIDAEIAYAVSQGIEEAAVTAGWQAYFDTLAAGGTEAEAAANAYEACGSACDNY